jgi:DNA-binding CsgD family transcriptional regulator
MPKQPQAPHAMTLEHESLRGCARDAWALRYDDAEQSQALVERLKMVQGQDAVADGRAALVRAFHATQVFDVLSARRHLSEAFGAAVLTRDDSTLANGYVVLAQSFVQEDDLDSALDCYLRAETYQAVLDPAERVVRLCYVANVHRRRGEMGDAYLNLTKAASEVEACSQPWAAALVAIGLSSLFIRSHEFRGAINLLRKVEIAARPFLHSWSANVIAAALRVGDSAAARTTALALVRSRTQEASAGIAFTWGVAALTAERSSMLATDAASATELCTRIRVIADRLGASPSDKACAAFANALCDEQDRIAIHEAATWLKSPPLSVPTELLAHMLRWAAERDAANRDEWLQRLDRHENSRHAAQSLAALFGPVLRIAQGHTLTEDEVAAVTAAASGLTMQDTAKKLGWALSKVKRKLSSAREKYQASSTQELIAQALAAGAVTVRRYG